MLSEPFLARVLRPIGSRALGAISSVLPANYLDSIRLKLLFSGLAGRYRPEEIVIAQVGESTFEGTVEEFIWLPERDLDDRRFWKGTFIATIRRIRG